MKTQKLFYAHDDVGYYKHCSRFLPRERAEAVTTQDAVVFDHLRQAGMGRNKALRFLKGQHCKVDSTQRKHGPPGYKIFGTKIDKYRQLNGWQMCGKLDYGMFDEYSDDNQWNIQDQNKEEQQKMLQLKQFYQELDTKYSFDEMSPQEVLTKLRSLSTEEQYKKRVPQFQIRDKKAKIIYYEMAEHILTLHKPPQTLIQKLDVFDNTVPLVRKEYFAIEPKNIKKAVPNYQGKSVEKRSKLLKELMRTYTNNVLVNEESDDIQKVLNLNDIWQLDLRTNLISISVLQQMVLLQVSLYSQALMRMRKGVPETQKKDAVLFTPNDVEVVNYNIFRNKLESIVNKGIKRIICETNESLF